MSDAQPARVQIAALRRSHDRLSSLIQDLTPEQVTGPSYCHDWTVAQVLSHLGSGAEIFSRILDAAVAGEDPPGRDTFPPIWDSWNNRPPDRQAADCRTVDGAFVHTFESLTDEQLSAIRLSMFGMELDAAGLARMRLSEHATHTWDVAVALDPTATVSPDAVALLLDHLGQLAGRSGKTLDERLRVGVRVVAPERDFLLDVDEPVRLSDGDGDRPDATIELPAEAFVRLVYGRLDPDHTPAGISASGVELDQLRRVFPGF